MIYTHKYAHPHTHTPSPSCILECQGWSGEQRQEEEGMGRREGHPTLQTTTSECESFKHPASHSRHLHKADLSVSLSQPGCLTLPRSLCWSQTRMVSHVWAHCFLSLFNRIKTRSLPSLFLSADRKVQHIRTTTPPFPSPDPKLAYHNLIIEGICRRICGVGHHSENSTSTNNWVFDY